MFLFSGKLQKLLNQSNTKTREEQILSIRKISFGYDRKS